jgi:hypothetical protein
MVRRVGLLLICFGALLFGLEKAREWVSGQHLSPVVLTAVLLGALGVLVWWLRHRNRNANQPDAKGSVREIKIHFSSGVIKALVLTFVVAVFWEIGYRYMRQSYAGTNVEISRFGGFNQAVQQAFPATTHLLGADRHRAANQQVFNPPAVQSEPTCTERGSAWNTDEIRPEEGETQFIINGNPGYVIRPGDGVMVCVEANNARDLHKLYIRVGGGQIMDSNQPVWQPDETAKRVWYAQLRPISFQPEVDETGGYLHFILKQGLTKPVKIFVRFK